MFVSKKRANKRLSKQKAELSLNKFLFADKFCCWRSAEIRFVKSYPCSKKGKVFSACTSLGPAHQLSHLFYTLPVNNYPGAMCKGIYGVKMLVVSIVCLFQSFPHLSSVIKNDRLQHLMSFSGRVQTRFRIRHSGSLS